MTERLQTELVRVKRLLTKAGLGFADGKEINYGVQLRLSGGLLRIYDGKKGLKLDLSAIKDEAFASKVQAALTDAPRGDYIHAGADESGKGDCFGPLCVAAVYVPAENAAKLSALGIRDSKTLTDKKMAELAPKIEALTTSVVLSLGGARYNEAYAKFGNLNKMLSAFHAKAAAELAAKAPVEKFLLDQFGPEHGIRPYFKTLTDSGITLLLQPRAEEELVVAAASVLARVRFAKEMDDLSKRVGFDLPKGAGPEVKPTAERILKEYGTKGLLAAAKLHFKTFDGMY